MKWKHNGKEMRSFWGKFSYVCVMIAFFFFFNPTEVIFFTLFGVRFIHLKKITAFAFVSYVGRISSKLYKYSPMFDSSITLVSIILNSNPSGTSLL